MLSILRKTPSIIRNNAFQSRNTYTYIGRPREQLSIVETWAHGIVMVSGIFAIPAWILAHVTEYRGLDKKKEE